jgi:subtilisin family serine protease
MRSLYVARAALLLTVALAACRDGTGPGRPETMDGPDALLGLLDPKRYIVVFEEGVTDPLGLAELLTTTLGGTLLYVYTDALVGFAAELPATAVTLLRLDPRVAFVEADGQMRAGDVQRMDSNGDPWGLDRIDQRGLPLSSSYEFATTASGVHAYIIDTGIWTGHADFGGRADNVFDFLLPLPLPVLSEDCNGHGTHVAGTVGGARWGVAKGVSLHGVRVLSCAGTGFTSGVIAGVDWVARNHVEPAVANMSLGGSKSQALDQAVRNLSDAGVFVAVAAGNDNADACTSSPAGAEGVFTVAASTETDAKASFSNWGTCVEIYAPGAAIKSAFLLGTDQTLSGTSMASPHAAGVAALYKATFGDVPSAAIARDLTTHATDGAIGGNPAGTPNRLLFKATL